jgi:aminoglycoside N3'-acetyltransferase
MKHDWAFKARYGTFSTDDLAEHLEARLAGQRFEILMVHSSYDALLPMYSGSPVELVRLLMELCGPERTLAMPAFVLEESPEALLRRYRSNPVFDVRRTPSHTGLVTELFRRKRGVTRSLHPTHSVCALGPLATEMVADHHLGTTPCGEQSPFGFMARHDTLVLGIGTPWYRTLSQAHSAEDLLGDDFPVARTMERVPVQLRRADQSWDYTLSVCVPTLERDPAILRRLLDRNELEGWRWKGCDFYRASAPRVTQALVEAAGRGETIYSGGAPRGGGPG